MARKGIFLVLSRPANDTPEGHAAFHAWYEGAHAPEVLNLPGWLSARRFKIAEDQLVPLRPIDPEFQYVAVYELEDVTCIPDSRALMGKLAQIYPDFFSPTNDTANMRTFVLEQIFETSTPTPLPDGVEL